jgi:hypothetical protein
MKYAASLHIDLWGNTWCLLWFWNQPSKSVFQRKSESIACQGGCCHLLYTLDCFSCALLLLSNWANLPI